MCIINKTWRGDGVMLLPNVNRKPHYVLNNVQVDFPFFKGIWGLL